MVSTFLQMDRMHRGAVLWCRFVGIGNGDLAALSVQRTMIVISSIGRRGKSATGGGFGRCEVRRLLHGVFDRMRCNIGSLRDVRQHERGRKCPLGNGTGTREDHVLAHTAEMNRSSSAHLFAFRARFHGRDAKAVISGAQLWLISEMWRSDDWR